MPVLILERLPLPSLRTYTAVSVLLLACALYFANEIVLEASTKNSNSTHPVEGMSDENVTSFSNQTDISHEAYARQITDTLMSEAWFVWTLINSAYCMLLLFGKLIQKLVFGELRVSEQTHMKDRFWNFVFYKFIFIFGVMNVQNMEEVFDWSAWFSLLGFLHILCQLCKDRFEYLSFSPTTPSWMHAKVLLLLCGILLSCGALTCVCVYVGLYAGINIFAFMIAECALLGLKSGCVMGRYLLHLWDMHHEGVWEHRASLVYYTDFLFDMVSLSVEFTHHLHMLLWSNIFLSMASLVICMQLRFLFHEFQRRIRRHKNYLRVVRSMEEKFPMATPSDLETNDDNCAICWDTMDRARKLPCGHFFHNSCLRSWLEQDTSCPTCRTSLGEAPAERPSAIPLGHMGAMGGMAAMGGIGPMGAMAPAGEALPPQPRQNRTPFSNHFFHFDGSRYISWLPSFSVEVTHSHNFTGVPVNQQNRIQTSQLDNMARQVVELFPSMPIETIQEDLQITHSVELTIENILEGRVTAPPAFVNRANSDLLDEAVAPVPDASSSEDSEPLSSHPVGHASLNFIQEDNVPHLSESVAPQTQQASTADFREEEAASSSGFRFSKSPSERENMLKFRKEALLSQALKRYSARQPQPNISESSQTREGLEDHTLSSPEPIETDDVVRRRELAFIAAQRRMNNQNE